MATRIAVVGSYSGQGKTTLARSLAHKIGGTFVEFDALRQGPNWTVTPDNELRAAIAPVVATERWTIDAIAEQTLGRFVLDRVELIVWLDLPAWVWLPRLLRRSARRWLRREELWNGNRETLRGIFLDSDGVFPHAIRPKNDRKGYDGNRRAGPAAPSQQKKSDQRAGGRGQPRTPAIGTYVLGPLMSFGKSLWLPNGISSGWAANHWQ